MQLSDFHPRRFFFEVWRDIDAEAAAHRARVAEGDTGDIGLAAYIFSVVAVSLVLQAYWGERDTFLWLLDIAGPARYDAVVLGGYFELWVLGYWAVWRVLGFLVLPALAVAVHPRLRRAPLGLTFRGVGEHLWIYGALFVPAFLAVFVASFSSEFTAYYPFYADAHRSLFDFFVWEAFYVAQFFSLELFFRGFMLQPLRRSMGSSAIFAMTVPYVMIHIGKPMLECFAAIVAGVVLGTLAMRTRSIWCGFLIHVSVALSMDLLAIWQVHG